MAHLIGHLAQSGSRKADGTVNASGKVYLYRAGTPSLAVGYTDPEATVPWTRSGGGIVLDVAGKAKIYTKEPCDVVVADSAGSVVDTISGFNQHRAELVEVENDGFTGALADGSSGSVSQELGGLTDLDTILTSAHASLGPDFQYQESAGATPRNYVDWLRDVWVSVKDFGAVGDGLTDDTAAIQKAIARVKALGGGVVYFPPGIYLISAALALASATGVSLKGSGALTSVIKATSTSINALAFTTCSGFTIEDLALANTGNATTAGLLLTDSGAVAVSRCSVSGYRFSVDSNVAVNIDRTLTISGCTLDATADAAARSVRLRGASLTGSTLVVGGKWDSTTTGNGLELQGSASNVTLIGLNLGRQAIGVLYESTWVGTGVVALGCNFGSCTIDLKSDPTSTATAFADVANQGFGSVVDASNGMDLRSFSGARPAGQRVKAITVAGAGTITPGTDGVANHWSITANGSFTFANGTAGTEDGGLLSLSITNATGGAITASFGAGYATSAAVSPAAGATINLLFIRNGSTFREVSRATA